MATLCRAFPMTLQDGIQKAVQLGERNKEIIELAKNWCAHLEVQRSPMGGVGLVEIQTGLPIGMRFFKCPYASAEGVAGMNLEFVALDFYDRNCVDCKQRQPVRIPNLSSLVGKRDAADQRAHEAQTQTAKRETQALAARTARRSELSRGCDPQRASIYSTLDAFDQKPNEHARQVLLGTATAGSQHFDSGVLEALFEIAEAGGITRAEGSLEVLELIGADHQRCCEIALRLLARNDGHRVAGAIVAKHLDKRHEPLVLAALPALIGLAMPVRGVFPGHESSGYPEPLISAFRLFPELVLLALRDHLRSQYKHARIHACNAITLVLQVDSDFGAKLIDDLIGSLDLPDDPYGENSSAEQNVAKTLAEVMVNYPDLVDARIQAEIRTSSEEVRSALFDVYERIFRLEFELDHKDAPPPRAVEISYQRFVDVLSNRAEDEILQKAIWFLRHEALRFPGLLRTHAETLLGAAALVAEDLKIPESPILDLSLTPDPLKHMVAEARHQTLKSVMEAILKPLGVLAAREPESIGRSILKMFDALGDAHDQLKAGLLKSLGHMTASSVGSQLALPALYQGMTSRSQLVRAAGAEAYGLMAKDNPDDLPSLVHETFLLLLGDPFVIVHYAALDALRKVSLPARFTGQIVARLAAIIATYSNSRSDDHILSVSLQQLLEIQAEGSKAGIHSQTQQAILSIVGNMKISAAADFIANNGFYLRGASGLGKLLIKLLCDADIDGHVIGDLVAELSEVPAGEILQVAGEFPSAAKNLREVVGRDVTDHLVEILTVAGAWSTAVEISEKVTSGFSDSVWDRPRKLRSQALESAARLEAAAAESNVNRVFELTDLWCSLEEEMRKNDEENKTGRSPLFGLPLADQSE